MKESKISKRVKILSRIVYVNTAIKILFYIFLYWNCEFSYYIEVVLKAVLALAIITAVFICFVMTTFLGAVAEHLERMAWITEKMGYKEKQIIYRDIATYSEKPKDNKFDGFMDNMIM